MSKEDKNFYKSGNKKFDEGDYQGAIDYYTKAIELDPENSEIYIKRGDVRSFYNMVDGNYQGAIDDYSKAIELDPKDPQTYIDRALCKKNSKDYQGAVDDSIKVIELDHKNIRALAYQKLMSYWDEFFCESEEDDIITIQDKYFDELSDNAEAWSDDFDHDTLRDCSGIWNLLTTFE